MGRSLVEQNRIEEAKSRIAEALAIRTELTEPSQESSRQALVEIALLQERQRLLREARRLTIDRPDLPGQPRTAYIREEHPVMQVRRLLPSDSIEALTALLHRAYAKLGVAGLNYTAVDQTHEMTVARIGDGACFVAISGDKLIGTIVVQPPNSSSHCEFFTRVHVASAHQFAVDPHYQGIGVGSELLSRAESWAREAGFSELALDTAVPASHLIAMYSRLGYREVGSVQWSGKKYQSVVLSKAI